MPPRKRKWSTKNGVVSKVRWRRCPARGSWTCRSEGAKKSPGWGARGRGAPGQGAGLLRGCRGSGTGAPGEVSRHEPSRTDIGDSEPDALGRGWRWVGGRRTLSAGERPRGQPACNELAAPGTKAAPPGFADPGTEIRAFRRGLHPPVPGGSRG